MRTTIFVRILAATLLPVLFVLMIVIGTARGIIHRDGIAYAREFVRLAATQISGHMDTVLQNVIDARDKTAQDLTALDFAAPDTPEAANQLLEKLLMADDDLYSVWVSFEPGVFSDGERYSNLLVKDDMTISGGGSDYEIFEDIGNASWYDTVISEGNPYTNISMHYDFKTGEGTVRVFVITYPVIDSENRVIGCLGIALRYENLSIINNMADENVKKIMLVSFDGDVLFSRDGMTTGKLWDNGFNNVSAALKAMKNGDVWQEEITEAAEKLFVCLHPVNIGNTGKTVYLYWETPANSLYSSFYSSMEIIISTGMIGMLLLTFCVFFTTRGIVRHVKRITDSFYHVANNSAGVTLKGEHIPTHQTNVLELDILQTALISMIVQLRNAHGAQLKALEAKVENEKLIASAQAKTNFFAAVSHEIRTPMNAIIGISEIMLNDGALTQEQEKNIRDIKISSDSLLNIINDILDISKMETGRMELHPEHYNFKALIDNIISLASRLSEDAGLRFEYNANAELPLYLYGDGTRLRQVLLNLIGNAVKYTRQGYISLRIHVDGAEIRFEIDDTGIGIKESEIDAVFESFRRSENNLNLGVTGTGLGLSVSKSLVEIMGGSIAVESVYGKGSTFTVKLPLVLGDEKKVNRKSSGLGTKYLSSLRVLVVDDNEINLHVSSGLLRTIHAINCDTALSGHEAIAKVRETDYDIVFMDHMMPEMDGLEATQRIRALGNKYQCLPIIALTANVVIGAQSELISGGMDDFLAKPIQSQKLQEILERWIPEDKRLAADAVTPPATTAESGVLTDVSVKILLEDEGVDTLAGMANIGFNEEVYLQSLKLLRDRLQGIARLLEELLEAENMRDFHIHVHSVKGSFASIGALSLTKDAQKLETAALDENADYCRTLLRPLLKKMRHLHETLCKALPESVADTAGYVDSVGSVGSVDSVGSEWDYAIFENLRLALERYDYDAVTTELNAILAKEYGPEKSKFLSLLKQQIENFDYTSAITRLSRESMRSATP